MRKALFVLMLISLISACANINDRTVTPIPPIAVTDTPPVPLPTLATDPVSTALTESIDLSTVPAPTDDFFTGVGITLPAPACTGLTQPQTEGPYYIPNSPEKHSLIEEGMSGTRLILVGHVLDQNCAPLFNAWLDFWQADANGQYDNAGFRLRGHQFTDAQGRYHLETILPGLYSSRPIEHIHVKVRPEGGAEVTSQLYFPQRPMDGLTVTIEERGDHLVGYFNFVVQK